MIRFLDKKIQNSLMNSFYPSSKNYFKFEQVNKLYNNFFSNSEYTTPTIETITIPGTCATSTTKYCGALLAPNGYVYVIPCTSKNFIKINPDTYESEVFTFSELPNTATDKIEFAAILNDKIVTTRVNGRDLIIFDTSTDTCTITNYTSYGLKSSGSSYYGAIAHPITKCVYFIPYYAHHMYKYNVETNIGMELTNDGLLQTQYFVQGALLEDDTILLNGHESGHPYIVFDPIEEFRTTESYNLINNGYGTWGSILCPGNKIIPIPYTNINLVSINRESKRVFNIASLSNTQFKYTGGVLAPNRKIYMFPWNISPVSLLELDVIDNTIINIPTGATGSGYHFKGGCVAPNGKIFSPHSALGGYSSSTVMVIDTHCVPKDPSSCLDLHFNHM